VSRTTSVLLAALAGAALAACNGGTKTLPARFAGPGGLAVFQGFTGKHPGVLHRYLAVANSRADDLRYVDVEDDQVVMSPTVVFPLSVPTTVSRPSRLVATPLGDEAAPGADLLLAVGAGSLRLELVATWEASSRIASTEDLGDLLGPAGPGTALLSLIAVPGAAGRARVYAGLSGARLAFVEYGRAAGGAIERLSAGLLDLASGTIPFDPLDIAAAPPVQGPAASQRLFIATNDPLGPGIFGVAQVDLAVNASTQALEVAAVRPLETLAPTRYVAAAVVSERSGTRPDDFSAPAGLRVYAFLDPSGCGLGFPTGCGLATLVPDAGLAPDPVDPALARVPIPIPIPSGPGGLSVAQAQPADPANGIAGTRIALNSSGSTPTTGLIAVAGPDAVYFVDLGRFALANSASFVAGTARAQATGVTLSQVIAKPFIDVADLATGDPVAEADRAAAIQVTPGFTTDDSWVLSYQGLLPGFRALGAVLGRQGADEGWLAFQSDSLLTPDPNVTWFVNARLDRPEDGVKVGDAAEVFEIQGPGTPACDQSSTNPTPGGFSATVLGFLPPSPEYPGGAVRLSGLGCLAARVDAAPAGRIQVGGQIRASGLLLEGRAFGYAGRPALDGGAYEIRWRPEAGIVDPEELLFAQKARRRHYPPSNRCSPLDPAFAGIPCNPVDPLASGPLLRLRVRSAQPVPPVVPAPPIPPGTSIRFQTLAGLVATTRAPVGQTSRPVGLAVVRRPPDPASTEAVPAERTDFYAAFEDGQVLHIPQGRPLNEVVTIR